MNSVSHKTRKSVGKHHKLRTEILYEAETLKKKKQVKIDKAREENNNLATEVAVATKKLKEVEQLKKLLNERISEVEIEHTKLFEQIHNTNSKLEKVKKRSSHAEKKISELQTLVSVLEQIKNNLEKTMNSKNKEMQGILEEMAIEKSKALKAAGNAERLLISAQDDLETKQDELEDVARQEHKFRDDLRRVYKQTLKKLEDQLGCDDTEQKYEMEAMKCREAVVQIKESYEKEYIKKSEVDKRILEVEEINREVEKLKCVVCECEVKMGSMEKTEIELRIKADDLQKKHQQRIDDLLKELDSATLQYTEAILEKTRLQNETSLLEDKVNRFYVKETQLNQEVHKLHKEYQETQNKLQTLMTQLVKTLDVNIGKKLFK